MKSCREAGKVRGDMKMEKRNPYLAEYEAQKGYGAERNRTTYANERRRTIPVQTIPIQTIPIQKPKNIDKTVNREYLNQRIYQPRSRSGSVMKKKKRMRKTVIFTLLLFVILGVGGLFYVDSLTYKVCRVEAGVEVKPTDFLKKPDESAVFTDDTQFDTAVPGEYKIKVHSGLFTLSSRLIVEDTIAPVAEAVPVVLGLGERCDITDFVTGVKDASKVTLSWKTEPDFTKIGNQALTIVLTDLGNNVTELKTELYISKVTGTLVIEAGDKIPDPSAFVLVPGEAYFLTNVDQLDTNQVGDYHISLLVDGEEFTSILRVADTESPQVEVQNINGFINETYEASEFVLSIKDASETVTTYEQEPDWSLVGQQEIHLVICDSAGNETRETAQLTLQEDKEPPVIIGAKDIHIYLGDSVSYRKNVTVTDNGRQEPELNIDVSQVNLESAGTYPVIYQAIDASGNTSTVTVTLTITERMYSLEQVDEAADKVLANILTENMTQKEKAEAIFKWILSNVGYINHSDGDDWVRSAYEGLVLKKGDCRVFAATAKELLTRAGIPNMDIAKIPAKTSHFWNLVDVGDGWLHFDTCPRKDQRGFCLWTEEDLMKYSQSHNGSHNYDHEIYPQVN